MRVVLAPLAAQDLQEAHDYIAADNPRAAMEFLLKVADALGLLASGIVTGSEVKLRDGRLVRGWSIPPYKIYYRMTGDELQVVRIYHQARRPIERRPRRRSR